MHIFTMNHSSPDCGARMLPTLLQLRQKIQHELDDALLEHQISLDSAASLQQAVATHFAEAIHRSTKESHCNPTLKNEKDGLSNDLVSDQQRHDSVSRLDNPASMPGTLATTKLGTMGLSTWPSMTSHIEEELSPGPSRPAKRRKRMPKVEGAYPCRHCEKPFDRAGDRTKHEAIHEPKRRSSHICGECDKTFAYPKDLRRHTERLHKTPQQITQLPTCSPTETLADSCFDSYFPSVDELLADMPVNDNSCGSLLPTPISPDDMIPLMAEAQSLYCYGCPSNEQCIQESMALLSGSLSLLVLAAEHHGVTPETTPCLAASFASLESQMTLLESKAYSSTDCLTLRQYLSAQRLGSEEIVPELIHAAHVLLTLLDFQDNGFQAMLAQIQAPQTGSMVDTMIQANALLSQSKVKAYASEYGTTMDQLVTGLGGLVLDLA
ncbi:hypothetical protein HII31_12101 [Pseudocercospora fuligena]|uniref:C2H2-type domain-containing protein n=1 Tax=Pseudocercospora fuligena TaxID=685502 RepID=A0A8H6R8N5_9PEZI|nr:hypothetical protein HII31_12101 [Pseudocercospora fuligena]